MAKETALQQAVKAADAKYAEVLAAWLAIVSKLKS